MMQNLGHNPPLDFIPLEELKKTTIEFRRHKIQSGLLGLVDTSTELIIPVELYPTSTGRVSFSITVDHVNSEIHRRQEERAERLMYVIELNRYLRS